MTSWPVQPSSHRLRFLSRLSSSPSRHVGDDWPGRAGESFSAWNGKRMPLRFTVSNRKSDELGQLPLQAPAMVLGRVSSIMAKQGTIPACPFSIHHADRPRFAAGPALCFVEAVREPNSAGTLPESGVQESLSVDDLLQGGAALTVDPAPSQPARPVQLQGGRAVNQPEGSSITQATTFCLFEGADHAVVGRSGISAPKRSVTVEGWMWSWLRGPENSG